MSLPQFLIDEMPDGEAVRLVGAEGRHAATVQRVTPGERIIVGDGRGTTVTATVVSVGAGSLDLRVERRAFEPPADPSLVVVQGIAKGDRSELAVQAMTEVGVDAIIPWAAHRSVVKWVGERGERSRQRWVDTARQATKQSRRAWQPTVTRTHSTHAVCARLADAAAAVVLHEEAQLRLSQVDLPATGEIVLVVGPEGGVAAEELAAFAAAGATPVRLGPQVLRTSTAGTAALAMLSTRLGRW